MTTPATAAPHQDQFTRVAGQPSSSAGEEGNTLSQSRYTLIAQQPFFKGLNAHQLQLLSDSAMEMQFVAGQMLFEEGSPANRFFLVLEGKVALESEAKEHGTIRICTLGPGDDLGWSWLFPPYYLHFSARALEPTRTIFFYGTRLREQCEQDHELGYQLMKRVAEAAVQNLHSMQQRLMACGDPNQFSTT